MEKVILKDDGQMVFVDKMGKESPITKEMISKDGLAIKLPKNEANRTWLMLKKLNEKKIVELVAMNRSPQGPRGSKLTEEETAKINELQKQIDAIKEVAKNRKPAPLTDAQKKEQALYKSLIAAGLTPEQASNQIVAIKAAATKIEPVEMKPTPKSTTKSKK